jgi:hypothetical protein
MGEAAEPALYDKATDLLRKATQNSSYRNAAHCWLGTACWEYSQFLRGRRDDRPAAQFTLRAEAFREFCEVTDLQNGSGSYPSAARKYLKALCPVHGLELRQRGDYDKATPVYEIYRNLAGVKDAPVPAGHWAAEAVNALVGKGIIAGGGFGGDAHVTGCQVARFLARTMSALGDASGGPVVKPSDGDKRYPIARPDDLPGGRELDVFREDVRKMLAQSIIVGRFSGPVVSPRGEIAVMLCAWAQLTDGIVKGDRNAFEVACTNRLAERHVTFNAEQPRKADAAFVSTPATRYEMAYVLSGAISRDILPKGKPLPIVEPQPVTPQPSPPGVIALGGARVIRQGELYYVPIVPIAEYFGGTARYQDDVVRADVRVPWGRFFTLRMGSSVATYNEGRQDLPGPAITEGGRALVPLDALHMLRIYWTWEGRNLRLRLGGNGTKSGLLPMP